ncbi:MAG: flagellar biosynthesis protein FlhB [Deltaproteobacteria bacterium]|nr:flagellar biosynthesis protein FlhB [Deltaproteobacteria bacterium]
MAENDQEKTEQGSSRRREQARQEGNFPVSREVSSFLTILGALLVLHFAGAWIFFGLSDLMRGSFHIMKGELTVTEVSSLFQNISYKFFLLILPALAIPVFGAVSYLLQNGFALTTKPLAPDLNRIDPLSGVKRLFSLNSLVELVKSIVKISVLAYVVYLTVAKEWNNLPMLMDADAAGAVTYIARTTFTIMTKTVWVLAVIAVLDYAFQRWSFEKGLRMTKEEIKEEMKETEGDPLVKARIKSIQREMARKRMMQDVPKADVVVTNPTHLAIAIKYDRSKADAPVVVAKGAGLVAEKIKELARANRVPVVENKPLARGLFKTVEVGMQIPVDMYKAVAELLAYVYRLKNRAAAH